MKYASIPARGIRGGHAEPDLRIALAGQANVGKSVIFNQLTGLHQHIANWPGTTVDKAEGTLYYKGLIMKVIDLPGIYSLTHLSIEEKISRSYIARERPDVVVNVVDATALERHLIFTLQLLELERPLILVLNMMDLAEKYGIEIDVDVLREELGVPVVTTIATRGRGVAQILDAAIELHRTGYSPKKIRYGKEVEERVERLEAALGEIDLPYPRRWIALKLLEKDEEIWGLVGEKNPRVIELASELITELESIHGHDSLIIIANERACIASQIARRCIRIVKPRKPTLGDRFDEIATHPILGYILAAIIFAGLFSIVFGVGGIIAELSEEYLSEIMRDAWVRILGINPISEVGWSAIESILFLLGLAIPYILPLYFLTFLLENWGYLARVSFLMDSLMHKAGVHGKAVIPMLLGFGCNVPACLAARIMDTWRERIITILMTTLVPCSAVTVVVMGLVGRYFGVSWVIGLYLLTLLIAFILGSIASRILPGVPVELIMEMPSYKVPSIKTILTMTWIRLREYLEIAAPLIIAMGALVKVLEISGLLDLISSTLSPITSSWLGLPKETGVLLIFGILRKELILTTLAALLGTIDFSQALTPNQMITLSIVTILYIPCAATISVLLKETGTKTTLVITLAEISLAILIGGIASKLLLTIGIS
ncbi:MAG: ferrous iron transport protein B [Aigarchaeota archaeon]|nr:ferrous iron transport protein B [Candidatus Wolframiiraptor gerlachensis]